MLEVAVGVEVEADQNRDDLRVGHHALPAAFRGVRRGRKGVFRHLDFKFFAKIIRNTENFSNFTLGNHDIHFKLGTSKLLNISEIAKKIGNFFQVADSIFSWLFLSRTRVPKKSSNKFPFQDRES